MTIETTEGHATRPERRGWGRVDRFLTPDRLVVYQRPRQVLFVESLPRNAMGKILRGDLRTLAGPKG